VEIISSKRRYFIKSNGDKEFIGREVRYEENGNREQIFVKELAEEASYQDIVDHIGSV